MVNKPFFQAFFLWGVRLAGVETHIFALQKMLLGQAEKWRKKTTTTDSSAPPNQPTLQLDP